MRYSGIDKFLQISPKLNETERRMYRRKLFKILIFITYSEIIEIAENGSTRSLYQLFVIKRYE